MKPVHRFVDIRILALGFAVVVALFSRPIDRANAFNDVTGSIPAVTKAR